MTTKLTLLKTSAPAGRYMIHWCCDYRMDVNYHEPEVDIKVNGSVKDSFNPEQRDDRWFPAAKFFEYTHTSGNIEVTMEFDRSGSGSVALRRARAYLHKVGD